MQAPQPKRFDSSLNVLMKISKQMPGEKYNRKKKCFERCFLIDMTTCILRSPEETKVISYRQFLETDYKKQGFECILVVEKIEDDQGEKFILRFPKKELNYRNIRKCKAEDLRAYFPVKQQILELRDIIKFGNAYEKVVEMKNTQQVEKQMKPNAKICLKNNALAQIYGVNKGGSNKVGQNCRICLQSQIDQKDPLVVVCKCKGDVGTIHVNCLKKWLQYKYKKTRIFRIQDKIFIKKIKCEICKYRLSGIVCKTIEKDNLVFELLPWKKPTKPYVWLFQLGVNMAQDIIQEEVFQNTGQRSKKHLNYQIPEYQFMCCYIEGKFFVKNDWYEIEVGVQIQEDIEVKQVVQIKIGRELFEFKNIVYSESLKETGSFQNLLKESQKKLNT